MKIYSAIVYLDNDVPEYMSGVIRIGGVDTYDEDGNDCKCPKDLVDNTEFLDSESLIEYVAKELNIDSDNVEVQEYE